MSAAQYFPAFNASAPTPPPDEHDTPAMSAEKTQGGIVSSCPDCGSDIVHPYLKELKEAQTRISELEEQIQVLTLRATTAMTKATEYETSLMRMNSLSSAGRSTPEPGEPGGGLTSPVPRSGTPTNNNNNMGEFTTSPERIPASGSRLARLIPTRMPSLRSATSSPAPVSSPGPLSALRSPPYAATPPDSQPASAAMPPAQFPMLSHTPPTPTVDASALLNQLNQEQKLRRAAEAEASKTKSEIEELTGQLFEQANEMVAAERKARARLEARVEVLERRDGEKATRLGVLETRIQRVERVRGLLAESSVLRPLRVERSNSPRREVGVGA